MIHFDVPLSDISVARMDVSLLFRSRQEARLLDLCTTRDLTGSGRGGGRDEDHSSNMYGVSRDIC